MAKLTAGERAKLPDRAFAYIDSQGKRRLPIADAAHVRNALARFNQVDFENDVARERARERLLRAAQKHRIVPVGFINNELRSERERRSVAIALPTGFVTLLMSDIEGSTQMLDRLGDTYGDVLGAIRNLQRAAVERTDGCAVEARADEFFAAFASPSAALDAALSIQRELARSSQVDEPVRIRMGLHAGYPTLRDGNYIGMAVHATARICDSAHGGQIVVSDDMRTALTGAVPDGVRFRKLGAHRLRGIRDEFALFQVVADGLPRKFPPLRL